MKSNDFVTNTSMSSTPDDGEVPQHAVEDDSHISTLQDEQLATDDASEDLAELEELSLPQQEDAEDLIPQLEADEDTVIHNELDESPSLPPVASSYIAQVPASIDDSASIPDDLPSAHGSGLSSPASDSRIGHPIVSRQSSTASKRPFVRSASCELFPRRRSTHS